MTKSLTVYLNFVPMGFETGFKIEVEEYRGIDLNFVPMGFETLFFDQF